MKKTYSLSLRYKKVAPFLFLITAVLVIASAACSYFFRYLDIANPYAAFLTKLFDLNTEGNVPTLFSTMLLFFAGLLLALMFLRSVTYGHKYQKYWLLLSVIFVLLALDESLQIHERVTAMINLIGERGELKVITERPPYLRYAWVVPYIVGVVVLFAVLYKFLFSLNFRTRLLFLLGGGIFVFGAVGLELFEAYFDSTLGANYYTVILYTIEEAFEMVGVIIFIYALLSMLAGNKDAVEIDFSVDFKEELKRKSPEAAATEEVPQTR